MQEDRSHLDQRTLFVGDVHGCAVELRELLALADFRPGSDRLLLTGDAFSRGPDPVGVWEQIAATRARMVLGNHDDRLLRHLRQGRDADPKPEHRLTLERVQSVADQLLSWLDSLPLWIADDRFVLVHAGLNPETGLEGTTREEFLAIRTWPPTDGLEGLRWHDHYRPDDRTLVFGHDAPGSLVVKRRPDGRPYLLGLDSGCVYGGQLSGYLLEEDHLIQVPSRQTC
jgi:hypothetical protein